MKQTSDHPEMRKWCERGRTKNEERRTKNGERRPRRHPNPFEAAPDKQKVESERMKAYREPSKRDFRRKREEPRNNRSRGVNIPQMSQFEMRKVREGLLEVFRTLLNSMMKEFQPRAKD
jgi:hypothetical protein